MQHVSQSITMKTVHKLLIIVTVCVVILKAIQYYLILPPSQPIQQTEKIPPRKPPTHDPPKLTVSVYYEALCPASRQFLIDQLLPAYELIPDVLTLDLIPYGKARTKHSDGNLTFACQHGPVECLANKIHACAIDRTAPEPYTQLKFIACMIADGREPEGAGRKCAAEVGVHWGPVANCSESEEGAELLKANGERTGALRPKLAFVPTVELDGRHEKKQEEVLQNFFSEVCKALDVRLAACF